MIHADNKMLFDLGPRQESMERLNFHETNEILLVLEGSGSYFLEKRCISIQPGLLVIIPPGTIHRSHPDPAASYNRFVVRYPTGLLRQWSTQQTNLFKRCGYDAQGFLLTPAQAAEVRLCIQQSTSLRNGGFGDDARWNELFVELLLLLCRVSETAQPAVAKENPAIAKVFPIIEYIDAHLEQQLTLDLLAKEFFVSKYYLCHEFKCCTGFTVVEFIRCRRVTKAKQLLREGVCVQEAGARAGFADNSHFIRSFGQLIGLSPGKYVRLCQDTEERRIGQHRCPGNETVVR